MGHEEYRTNLKDHQAIDPICGMTVTKENAAGKSNFGGEDFYFCSEDCKKEFDKDPATNSVSVVPKS